MPSRVLLLGMCQEQNGNHMEYIIITIVYDHWKQVREKFSKEETAFIRYGKNERKEGNKMPWSFHFSSPNLAKYI